MFISFIDFNVRINYVWIMKGLTSLAIMCYSCEMNAQVNLVPNPSFEDTTNCPNNSDQLDYSTGWNSYSNTPDYFNSCAIPGGVSVPYNFGGFQNAAGGDAYVGFASYMSPALIYSNFREFVGRPLSGPLVISQKYYVSFSVCLSVSSIGPSSCATNNIGARFSTIPYTALQPTPIDNSPMISSSSIISDSINWTKVFGSFVADSAYQYIQVGNFFNDILTDTLIVSSDSLCAAYYFLDDVCVSTDSAFCYDYIFTGLSTLDEVDTQLSIFPNPVSEELNVVSDFGNMGYSITDSQGKQVLSGILVEPRSRVNVGFLEEGLYFLIVDGAKSYKLQVLH